MPVAEVFDEERAVDAVAVRPVSLGKPDGRLVGLGRHRLEPVPRRPRFGAFGIGRDPVGHGHARIAATGELLAGIPDSTDGRAMWRIPRSCFPRLAVKPRAWRESSIPPDVPDDYTRVA